MRTIGRAIFHQVLIQAASEGDVQHLQAAANREDGNLQLQRPFQQREVHGVAGGVGLEIAGPRHLAIAEGFNIGATSEQQSVKLLGQGIAGRQRQNLRGVCSAGAHPGHIRRLLAARLLLRRHGNEQKHGKTSAVSD